MKISLNERLQLLDKFLTRVERVESGCWLWQGAATVTGYGRIYSDELKKNVAAHRLAWRLFIGEINDSEHILHTCDTPLCVNPQHLFAGTHQDNMQDMARKGRGSHSKFTAEQVLDIREKHRLGMRIKDLAREHSVADGTISSIVHRRNYSWV